MVYKNKLNKIYFMHILHKFVLSNLTQKCVETTQSCVHRTNTRICVFSQHKCF